MNTTTTKQRSGLDLDVKPNGREADAYEVACTAVFLAYRKGVGGHAPARHAAILHRISGQLHRISERQCNEDLTCKTCHGSGDDGEHHTRGTVKPCKACAGRGQTTGRTEARLERYAREIAGHHGCRAYFQGDPRGCSLYLVPEEIIPSAAELEKRDTTHAVSPKAAEYLRSADAWVESNYTKGHAIARLGR